MSFGNQAILLKSDASIVTVDTDDDYTDMVGQIVLFRSDDKGVYTLRTAPNSYQNNTGIAINGSYGSDRNGWTTGGVTDFVLRNTQADFDVNGSASNVYEDLDGIGGGSAASIAYETDGVTPISDTVYANSETVFVVAETDASNKTTYNAYVGIKNVPNIYSDDPSTPLSDENAAVEMFYYVRGNNILAFAFIDAGSATVVGGKNDVVFLAGDTGLKGKVYDSDGTEYYLYNAVVGGEITTMKVSTTVDNFAQVGDDTANYVLQNPKTNNKGVVTSFAAGLTGYTQFVSNGIWKLNGAYTIGLGGSSASTSVRHTVATNAQIFYVDKDGNITKLDSVNNIVSDSNDVITALRDNSTGDLTYIFIQEKGHDTATPAPGAPTPVSAVLAAPVDGATLNITLSGGLENAKYTVKVTQVNASTGYSFDVFNSTVTRNASASQIVSGPLASSGFMYIVYVDGVQMDMTAVCA